MVAFYNPQRSSAVNIVPGLIGVILTMTMVLFTAVAIVRERERGNMELLIATPLSRSELMVGKVLPYVAIGLLQTTVVLALGMWLFDVPVRGGVLDVYVAAMLLIVANLTLGLLISTRAQSQFQAMQMTFFVFLPSILLSGFMFPFAGMPRVVQWLAEVLPLLYLHGLSTSDFTPALEQFLGSGAGLSASTITRLTAQWQDEAAAFGRRDLSGTDYVYLWVDGIHLKVRLDQEKLCLLVMLGVRADGRKELVAITDGP